MCATHTVPYGAKIECMAARPARIAHAQSRLSLPKCRPQPISGVSVGFGQLKWLHALGARCWQRDAEPCASTMHDGAAGAAAAPALRAPASSGGGSSERIEVNICTDSEGDEPTNATHVDDSEVELVEPPPPPRAKERLGSRAPKRKPETSPPAALLTAIARDEVRFLSAKRPRRSLSVEG